MYVLDNPVLVHLNHKNGIYKVTKFDQHYFTYEPKYDEPVTLPFYYFKSLHKSAQFNTDAKLFVHYMKKMYKDKKMWIEYQNYLYLNSFNQMSTQQLNLYFSKPEKFQL